MKKYELIVCGAGPAGICAAIAAGRKGVKTLLIEEDAFPGGAAVDYGVQLFCGEPIEGIHQEIREELDKIDPYYQQTKRCFSWISLVKVVKEMLKKAKVDFLPYSKVIGGREGKENVDVEVLFSSYKGIKKEIFWTKIAIDATGNGDLATSMGCEFRFGREAKNEFNESFAPEKEDNFVQQVTWMYICEKVKEMNYKNPGPHMGENKYLVWGGGFECNDPTNPEELEKTQKIALKSLKEQFKKLEKNGFRVIYLAPKIGIRETRRIIGDYILNEQDLRKGKKFSDAICRAKYPLDPWGPQGKNPLWKNPEGCRVPFYYIPYRSILVKGKERILTAGRCISGTHIAMSSYRVMPIVSLIGQAAGTAAALAIKNNTSLRKINITKLQSALIKGMNL